MALVDADFSGLVCPLLAFSYPSLTFSVFSDSVHFDCIDHGFIAAAWTFASLATWRIYSTPTTLRIYLQGVRIAEAENEGSLLVSWNSSTHWALWSVSGIAPRQRYSVQDQTHEFGSRRRPGRPEACWTEPFLVHFSSSIFIHHCVFSPFTISTGRTTHTVHAHHLTNLRS